MPFGTPIVAPSGWRLVGQGEDKRSGKWVRVQMGDGSVHSFAHLSRWPSAKEGRAGDPIAFSGKDADDRNGHLHTRSWVNGKEIDPASYFKKGR